MYEFVFDVVTIGIYFVLAIVLTSFIVFYYSKKNCSLYFWYVNVIVFVVFFLSFFSVGFITVDMSGSLYSMKFPNETITIGNHTEFDYSFEFFSGVVHVNWQIIYWIFFVFSNFIIPFFESWVKVGQFNPFKKAVYSILDQAIFYGISGLIYLLILIGLVIYIVSDDRVSFDLKTFPSFVFVLTISLANAYGFIRMNLLLGFGFGVLPMNCFRKSNHEKMKKYYEFLASDYYDEYFSTKDELITLNCTVRYIDVHIKQSNPKRKYVDIIKKRLGEFYDERASPRNDDNLNFEKVRTFEKLHREIIKIIRKLRQKRYRWKKLCEKYYNLEDIINSKNGIIKSSFKKRGIWGKLYSSKAFQNVQWIFYKKVWKYFWIFVGVFIILCAIIICWCEFTPIFQVWNEYLDLSIISQIIRLVSWQRWIVQIISLTILSFMTFVIFYGTFNIRCLEKYQFIRFHTDPYAILFVSVFLGRIIPCLCFDFLQMSGVTKKDKVSFFAVMANAGNLSGLDWIYFGQYMGTFLPLIIPFVALCVLFDLFGWIGKTVGYDRFVLHESILFKNNAEKIKEGKTRLKSEKKIFAKELIGKKYKDKKVKNKELETESSSDENQNLSDISSDENEIFLPRSNKVDSEFYDI